MALYMVMFVTESVVEMFQLQRYISNMSLGIPKSYAIYLVDGTDWFTGYGHHV
jgi:hypothetical protein